MSQLALPGPLFTILVGGRGFFTFVLTLNIHSFQILPTLYLFVFPCKQEGTVDTQWFLVIPHFENLPTFWVLVKYERELFKVSNANFSCHVRKSSINSSIADYFLLFDMDSYSSFLKFPKRCFHWFLPYCLEFNRKAKGG